MKTLDYTCTQPGADHGKCFKLTRMDAFSADQWARHCLQAAVRGGAQVGADLAQAGLAGLAALGIEIFGFMEETALDKALDRLMHCVSLRPDPTNPALTRPVIAADFEEPETLGLVRAEVFRLHVGFLLAAAHQLFPVVAALLGEPQRGKAGVRRPVKNPHAGEIPLPAQGLVFRALQSLRQ